MIFFKPYATNLLLDISSDGAANIGAPSRDPHFVQGAE